jgi:hypothetical protein
MAVGIVKLAFTITELWQFFGQKLLKKRENALLEKIPNQFLLFFCFLCYYLTLSHYKLTTTRRKSDYLPMKKVVQKMIIYIILT